ncbi:MAG: nucleoside hydrolase [Corynebacterium sp.]|nr:nucleoside hydrolase [Corynebacterium sp.]
MKPTVIIDCDPGIDDAIALIYLAGLHKAGEITLAGVTTTAGNVDISHTTANARWILDNCGLTDVPVAPGLPAPLEVPLITTPETHGPSGLGYLEVPPVDYEHNRVSPSPTWQDIWDAALRKSDNVHLLVTGPLTNAAHYYHEVVDGKRSIAADASFAAVTVMGGAINYRGNTTPTAEWNFWVDPHAAQDFFAAAGIDKQSGLFPPATLCSLGVTEQFLITPQTMDALIETLGGHPLAAAIPPLLQFYFEFHEKNGEGYQAQIHDALTAMVAVGALPADAVRTIDTMVDIEADSSLMRGTSVADLRNHWETDDRNCHLVTAVEMSAAHSELLRVCAVLAQ